MDLIGEERGRLERLTGWLQATPAEALGLVVLLVGALAATGALVWGALGRPSTLPDGDAEAVAVDAGPADAAAGDAAAGVGVPAGDAPDPGREPGGGGADAAAGVAPSPDGGTAPAAGPGGTHEEVTVHVAGAVGRPGVVTLPAGSRVADAIAAAGGLLDDADPSGVNLARPLVDGEQVVVVREGELPPPPAPEAAGEAGGGAVAGPVDLNTATVAQLETLPGIGPTLAQRIVDHREQHGPFREVAQLREVSGIGERRFQDLVPHVTVG